MRTRHSPAATPILALGFAVGGAVSRYNLQTTETRWQILAFAALSASVEVVARLSGPDRGSAIRGTVNTAVAAAVIIAVKLHLEPTAREQGSVIVHHVFDMIIHLGDNMR